MSNFDVTLSLCLFVWILMVAEKTSGTVGGFIMMIILIVYRLVDNNYFGDR